MNGLLTTAIETATRREFRTLLGPAGVVGERLRAMGTVRIEPDRAT